MVWGLGKERKRKRKGRTKGLREEKER